MKDQLSAAVGEAMLVRIEIDRLASTTDEKLDKATEGLEDQGPLSVLGIAVNSLF